MRLGTRIFVANLIIVLLCFSYPVYWAWTNLRIRYLESVEDPLYDEANILASIVAQEMESGRFRPDELFKAFQDIDRYPKFARIYRLNKMGVDTEIYITDHKGKVIFDSLDKGRIGEDYSYWRDVSLTLQGAYGARTTRKDPKNPATSVLHVAAPIIMKGKIAGVLTVAKPTATINSMLQGVKPFFLKVFGISAIIAVILMILISYWLALPIRRLTRYANDITKGRRVTLPRLTTSEIGKMGRAFERMRVALEGKRYVEEYVQTLTHEIKSPLSAIRGAAELLGEKMEPDQQARFLTNIRSEANRIQNIVDRMLELSTLENLNKLEKKERISFSSLLKVVLESKQAMLAQKNIEILNRISSDPVIEGDTFLLHQAIANLIQNALDFSPRGGRIDLSVEVEGNTLRFVVRDFGPGMPDYAKTRVFDKFFSLQRPDTGKKSTGLGLNLVREVAHLHQGAIEIDNCPDGGLRAELTLPCMG